jgi:hypothetical protein
MIGEFFQKIKETRIDSWSLSSLMVTNLQIREFPPDWKRIFCGYITSLKYVGSVSFNPVAGEHEDWSMSSSDYTV